LTTRKPVFGFPNLPSQQTGKQSVKGHHHQPKQLKLQDWCDKPLKWQVKSEAGR